MISAQEPDTYEFSFILTNLSRAKVSDYNDKLILLEWGASWCTVCENNQISMNEVYDEYRNTTNFLSISYGGSGDDLNDVKDMQARGPYSWPFGLDNANFAATVGARNGDMVLLDQNLNVIHEWDYQLLSANDIRQSLDKALGLDKTYGDEINLLGLDSNPLFLGFIVISLITVATVVIVRLKK